MGNLSDIPAGGDQCPSSSHPLGPECDHYSLTLLFHLALATLSGTLALWASRLSADATAPVATARQHRVRGLLLLDLGVVVPLTVVAGAGAITARP